jgi:hypothetical protein
LKNSVFRRFVKSDISQKTTLDKETVNFVGNNQRLIGCSFCSTRLKFTLRFNARRNQSAGRNQHIKFYFWRRKKEIEILDALSNSKDNVINVAGKMKLQQELALISNLDVMVSMDSGNAHIAAMLG